MIDNHNDVDTNNDTLYYVQQFNRKIFKTSNPTIVSSPNIPNQIPSSSPPSPKLKLKKEKLKNQKPFPLMKLYKTNKSNLILNVKIS
jgi:hypothetical protein